MGHVLHCHGVEPYAVHVEFWTEVHIDMALVYYVQGSEVCVYWGGVILPPILGIQFLSK